MQVTEVSIAQLRAALESGQTTAVELVQAYLARIDAYDGPDTATALNAVVVRNPEALKEAEASDERRANGQTLLVVSNFYGEPTEFVLPAQRLAGEGRLLLGNYPDSPARPQSCMLRPYESLIWLVE